MSEKTDMHMKKGLELDLLYQQKKQEPNQSPNTYQALVCTCPFLLGEDIVLLAFFLDTMFFNFLTYI